MKNWKFSSFSYANQISEDDKNAGQNMVKATIVSARLIRGSIKLWCPSSMIIVLKSETSTIHSISKVPASCCRLFRFKGLFHSTSTGRDVRKVPSEPDHQGGAQVWRRINFGVMVQWCTALKKDGCSERVVPLGSPRHLF